MSEVGKITEINGNKATILLTRKSACANCHACQMSHDEKEMVMTAINECGGKIGDNVKVELVVDRLMFATFILYGVPLITTVLGFGIGYAIFKSEIMSFFTGIVVLFITYFVIRRFEKFFSDDKYIPVAKEIVYN